MVILEALMHSLVMSCKQIMAYLNISKLKNQGQTAHEPRDLNLDEILTLVYGLPLNGYLYKQ